MKIVYCIAGTYNSGGMERILAYKINYLARQGHEVLVVTTDQCGRVPFFALDARIKSYDLGINYEDNNGKSFWNKLLHYPFKQWSHKKRLTKLLKRLNADIVVSMFCNDASILTGINDGSKKILECHFSRFKRLQYGRKGVWHWADKWRAANDARIAARFDKFIVLTKEDYAYWEGLNNMQVISNVRTFIFEKPATLDSRKVLAVGRYDYQKGFERLIEAWGKVCNKADDWELQIVGNGELKQEMLRQIKNLGLDGKVILRRVSGSEMPSTYQDASIFALSSRYEGLPMVLLEAQAAGLPIVSFDCKCGPKDIIEDGVSGFLVKEGDVDALANRLLTLINNENLRREMGQAAYRNSSQYAEEVIMKQWEDLFLQIIKK